VSPRGKRKPREWQRRKQKTAPQSGPTHQI